MRKDYFNESALDDILGGVEKLQTDTKAGLEDIKKGIGEIASTARDINKMTKGHVVNSSSIVARSKNSVLQFPIYVSSSIRVTEAQVISKLFERVYTTLVQTVLSQNPYIDENEVNSLKFLKRFHSNIKEGADVLVDQYYNRYFEAIDEVDQIIADSVFFTQQLSESVSVEFKYVLDQNPDLLLENTRLMNEPLTGFPYLQEAAKATKKATPLKILILKLLLMLKLNHLMLN